MPDEQNVEAPHPSDADTPQLSVVIPCGALHGQAAGHLREQLDSLTRQDWHGAWEVVLADNDGSGAVEEVAKSYRDRLPGLRVVQAGERRGKPYAVNTAVRSTRGRVLVMLDSDDTVDPGYLAAVARAAGQHDVLGARLETSALNDDWVRARRGELQARGLDVLLDHQPAVVGAGLSLTRAAWDAVGGFDETMTRQQDIDLAWRLGYAGYSPTFVPDAVVHYRYRHDLRGIWRQELAYGEHEVLLHARHRAFGAPPRPVRRTLGAWARILLAVPRVGSRAGRARLVTDVAAAVGRLRGSLRHRRLYL